MVVDSTPGGVRLTVNGKLITLFRTANGSLSAQDRANRAAERLEGLIAKGLTAKDIEARSRPEGGWGVYAQGGLVMIATQDEADLRKEEPEVTARRWAANLKAALAAAPDKAGTEPEPKAASKPAPKATGKPAPKQVAKPAPAPSNDANLTLGVRIDDVPVPLGESRTVNVRGTARGPVALKVDGTCVRARVVNGGDAIQIQGLNLGKASVRIARGGKETIFTAWVKKWAGVVAQTPAAMVTGTVAPADYVKKVAVEKAFDGVRREPETNVSITGSPDGVKSLVRGASTVVRVPIAISGANYMERREVASVRVDNVALKSVPARVLLYSNDPESVREYRNALRGPGGRRRPGADDVPPSKQDGPRLHVRDPPAEPEPDAGGCADHRGGRRAYSGHYPGRPPSGAALHGRRDERPRLRGHHPAAQDAHYLPPRTAQHAHRLRVLRFPDPGGRSVGCAGDGSARRHDPGSDG